ncbi:hypothetical protein E1281_26505 [Actinomadura sp. KC345]|uniref:hypothetical protein n=1 Tax=Actinomadura sp. KC345 TaxID=2530371 RepID=UPI00104724EE|nr:hypothetical protein [Actinomadura sp. KC345]TDC47293.1 hypothetical protein E1281_26505 [Actinomadura sp. KC345]
MSAEAIEAVQHTSGMIEPMRYTSGSDEYDVIHLGGEAAAVVPLDEFRRLKALEEAAPQEALEEAEATALYAKNREWEAEGRPGAMSHEEATRFLLGEAE